MFVFIVVLFHHLFGFVNSISCPEEHPTNWNSMASCIKNNMPEEGDGFEYTAPSEAIISAWKDLIEDSLDSELIDCPTLSSTLSSIFTMTKIGSDICVVAETNPGEPSYLGYGTYVFRLGSTSKIHIQIPHGETELYVVSLGLGIFNGANSEIIHSVLINGVARDADPTDSTCQASNKVADAAHNIDNLFYHGSTVISDHEFIIFQFHGKGSCGECNLYYTSGTDYDSEHVDNLSEIIDAYYPTWINWSYQNVAGEYGSPPCENLSGTSNVEGRYMNTVMNGDEVLDENICDNYLHTPTNFIHLELDQETRQKTTEWIDILEKFYDYYDFTEEEENSTPPNFSENGFTRKFACQRDLSFRKCFPKFKNCIISGEGNCDPETRRGITFRLKNENLFYLIRNKVFPSITIGNKKIDVSTFEDGSTTFLQDLENERRFSIGLWGLFEYQNSILGDIGDGFDPENNMSWITQWYFMNTQNYNRTKHSKSVVWKSKSLGETVKEFGDQKELLDFQFLPSFFSSPKSFPRVSFRAFLSNKEIQEDARIRIGKYKYRGMNMNPSGVKLSLNVSRVGKCRNESSDGIGFAFLVVTNNGLSEKEDYNIEEDEDDSDFDSVDQSSKTNLVFNLRDSNGEVLDDEYISFKKRVLIMKRNLTTDDEKLYFNSSSVQNIVIKKSIASDNIVLGSGIDLKSKILLDIKENQKIDVIWISIPNGCNINAYYYDPGLGYSESFVEVNNDDDDDSGVICGVFSTIIFLIFIFL